MKCPLPIICLEVDSYPPEKRFRDCLKEDCAWWSKAIGACSILGLEVSLSVIGATLLQIRDKMPHELQFRK